MLKNKKAVSTLIIIGGVIFISIILFLLYTKGVFASTTMTSTVPRVNGCNTPQMPVSVKGSVFTKDIAYFGVTVEPEKITVDQVQASGKLLGIFSEDYTWNIKIVDTFTGNVVTQTGGKNNHPGGGVLVEDKYILNFFIPDNNCDGVIDSFEGILQYNVNSDKGHDVTITKPISFQNGRYVR